MNFWTTNAYKQNVFQTLFFKRQFIDHKPDPNEIGLEIKAGDLTIHHGSIWHRVQQSPYEGSQSRRRVLYIPVITGKYQPKHANSKTPFYQLLANLFIS